MWVAIEGTTLASVFLVTFYGRATSLEAAWKYAIIGGVGLSMALFGTIVTYYAAHPVLGSESLAGLNWSVLVLHAAQFDRTAMRLAFILMLLGYGTKAGIAPMHTWKPDAYSEAPSPAAISGHRRPQLRRLRPGPFLRPHRRMPGPGFASQLLMLFGLLSMGVAVPFILVQRNFRRLLAYSTIDHAGIMVLALGFGGHFGTLGMLLHMTFHAITKPLLFFCAGNVQQHIGTDFSQSQGRRAPLYAVHRAPHFLLAHAGRHRHAALQPVSERVHRSLRAGFGAGAPCAGVLFVIFVVAIFCGLCCTSAKLVLGPDPISPHPATPAAGRLPPSLASPSSGRPARLLAARAAATP